MRQNYPLFQLFKLLLRSQIWILKKSYLEFWKFKCIFYNKKSILFKFFFKFKLSCNSNSIYSKKTLLYRYRTLRVKMKYFKNTCQCNVCIDIWLFINWFIFTHLFFTIFIYLLIFNAICWFIYCLTMSTHINCLIHVTECFNYIISMLCTDNDI